MDYNPEEHHRRSIRLKGYDYTQEGGYFITICVQDHQCSFGRIIKSVLELSPIGKMAQKFWTEIPNHHSNVQLDEYIVMPNHIHGVLFLHNENKNVGVKNFEPLQYKKHSY